MGRVSRAHSRGTRAPRAALPGRPPESAENAFRQTAALPALEQHEGGTRAAARRRSPWFSRRSARIRQRLLLGSPVLDRADRRPRVRCAARAAAARSVPDRADYARRSEERAMSMLRMALAALLIGCPAAASTGEIGRLFHSAAERAALDALRNAKSLPHKPAAAKPAQSAQVDGYVVRPDGKSTLWLNGNAVSSAR